MTFEAVLQILSLVVALIVTATGIVWRVSKLIREIEARFNSQIAGSFEKIHKVEKDLTEQIMRLREDSVRHDEIRRLDDRLEGIVDRIDQILQLISSKGA